MKCCPYKKPNVVVTKGPNIFHPIIRALLHGSLEISGNYIKICKGTLTSPRRNISWATTNQI